MPGFPNLLMLGGPNTFPGSGSFTYFNEIQMQYIRQLITRTLEEGADALDVTRERYEKYNKRVDDVHARTVWRQPGMSTFFRNDHGRVVLLNPFLNVEFWQMTRTVDLNAYNLRRRSAVPR